MLKCGYAFNAWFEKFMFLIIPFTLLIGFLLSSYLKDYVWLVPYLFAYITLVMAIGCGFGQMKAALKQPKSFALLLFIAHIVSPIIAYGMGLAVFGAGSPYIVGLVVFTIIPIGVSSVLWVSMSGGNISLMLAMVVIDSLLSPIIVPLAIRRFFGSQIHMDTGALMLDLILIIVLPTIIGIILYEVSKGKLNEKVKPIAAPISKLCFVLVVLFNAAAIAPSVLDMKADMIKIIPISVILVLICYWLGYIVVYRTHSFSQKVTMSYASGMRNISLGIVVAMSYFSPAAAVPVVVSILVQQPLATIHHYILQKINNANIDKVIKER